MRELVAEAYGPPGDVTAHRPLAALEASLQALPASPRDSGRVTLIVRRRADGVRESLEAVHLSREEGVPGDGWSRRPPRNPDAQLAVMRSDVAEMIANGQSLTDPRRHDMSATGAPNQLPDWMRDHVRRYRESNGADGHLWTPPGGGKPVPTLLLTTTGRKSKKRLVLPLIYGKTDKGYAIVASKGGAPSHPAWYLNLSADPNVEVQVGPEKFEARARTASGAERAALWKQMAAVWPPYDDYQRKTQREIPVVVLEPR